MSPGAHPASAAPPPAIAVIVWAMLIFSLLAGGFWMQRYSARKEARWARKILVAKSAAPLADLADCLGAAIPLTGRPVWRDVAGSADRIRGANAARHLTIEIAELGDHRLVTVFTRNAAPLRRKDEQAFARCL